MFPSPTWSRVFQAITAADPRPMLLVNCQGEILAASPSALRRFTGGSGTLLGRPLSQLVMRDSYQPTLQALSLVFDIGRAIFPTRVRLPNRHGLNIVLTLAALPFPTQPLALAFIRRARKTNPSLTQIDQLFTRHASRQEFLASAVQYLQNLTGCECAGIRLLDDEGNIPYAASLGFSSGFLQIEDQLSVCRDNCVCTRAITGDYQVHDLPILSEAGSFNVSDPEEYVLDLHPLLQQEYRAVCMQEGFKSIAAIPIRDGNCVLGAIHITDRRAGMLTPQMILALEAIAANIGELVHQYQVIGQLCACQPPSA